jgi:hypothetical protein
VNKLIADKVIAIAEQGERDIEQICLEVLADLRRQPPAGC